MKTITEYTIKDKDGNDIKVRYTDDSCMCSGDCNSDKLEIFCVDDWYWMEIDLYEFKQLIKLLLDKTKNK